MPLETEGFDACMNDIGRMAQAMDANDTGAAVARTILQQAAQPIHTQMKQNASSDPAIITGALHRSIRIGKVRKRQSGGQTITIGVHHSEADAFYANPVEYGHGGPAPAPAHPFVRPAFDTRQDEAYNIIRDGLRDAIDSL